ncbi:MAG: glutamate racemase [Nitrospira bacterium SM23_35]|jgi:glutamate racemase|nr:MAG: glutamate racemase [Nitrospira bacterium SM23_35]
MSNDIRNRPIGIFDSGIGGLTVLKEILRVLPDENTIYLGDTARVPYGIRSPETVIRYSFENTKFLSFKDIKILVVACNTASSVGLGAVKSRVSIPVVGVIEPGAKAAVAATKSKKIGVIGTEATINSSAYARAIQALDESIEVVGLACPLFVPLVEEGWTEGHIAAMVAEKYLSGLQNRNIDTVVLGCTHYPLLKNVIAEEMGAGVRLIDSAIEISQEIRIILEKLGMKRDRKSPSFREYYVTDSPERFVKVGEHFLGQQIEHIEKIIVGH